MAVHNGYSDLGFAKVDVDRQKRRGFAEVIYCPGKTRLQLEEIARELIKHKQSLLLTRLDKDDFAYLKDKIPGLRYNAQSRLGYLINTPKACRGMVTVITAGTADIPVAEEAALVLRIMGNRIMKFYDVGVAGVHRIMGKSGLLKRSKVIIVVAGMEGALVSLVSGLVSCPVIAVPTSCGYGANFRGLSALLGMLNSCSPGVAVVNIDNGFGAGYFASLINK